MSGYDAWKLRDPCETWAGPYGEDEEGPCVCGDTGWLEFVRRARDPLH